MIFVLTIFFIFVNYDSLRDRLRPILFGKKDDKKYTKICPRCGSDKIAVDFSNPAVWAYGATTKYKCKSCGYMGNSFPDVVEGYVKTYMKEARLESKKGKSTNYALIDATTGYPIGMYEIILGIFAFLFIPLLLLSGGDNFVFAAFFLFYFLIIFYLVRRIYKMKPKN